jgi:hypothetical protein
MQDENDRIDYLLRILTDDDMWRWWELCVEAELYQATRDPDEPERFNRELLTPIH